MTGLWSIGTKREAKLLPEPIFTITYEQTETLAAREKERK